MNTPENTTGMRQGMIGITLMSTVPVVIKWINADPWVIGFARLMIATTALLLLHRSGRQLKELPKRDWGILGLLGLCFGLHWITYFFSIKLGSATMAVIATISFYGIFLSVAGSYVLGHRIRWFHGLGLVLAVSGTLLVGGQFEAGSQALTGFVIGIISGAIYGSLPIIHQKAKHLDSNLRSWGQFAGALIVFTVCIPLGNWTNTAFDWAGILYLGLVGTLAAHTLWVHAVSELPTTISSLLKYLYIPLTAVISYFILGETLTVMQIIGAVIIVAGSMLGMLGDRLPTKS